MKKIAIYAQEMNTPSIFEALNKCRANSKSLFFEKVGGKPTDHDFGIFSSTEILNYNGPLIIDFIQGVRFAVNCCNTRSPFFYLYNKNDRDLMGLLEANLNGKVIICCLPEDEGEVLRKTGMISLIVKDLNDLIEKAMKHE
jgi:hypothetical protein